MTKKLNLLFLAEALLLISHGLEEFFIKFYESSLFFSSFPLELLNFSPKLSFIIVQLLLLLFLLFTYWSTFILKKSWGVYMLFVVGLIIVYEIGHVIEAISSNSYKPGLITAIAILSVGIFYWKELAVNLKSAKNGSVES